MERGNRNESRNGGYNEMESEETESRRRRRKDGTFMRGEGGQVEIEYEPRGEGRGNRPTAHKGPDDDDRRRIGFSQRGQGKSHWAEEEFVGDMEESLYHEVDDIFHYLEVCDKVYKKGYDDLAGAFYEIANEKFICAEFLRHQLKKIGSYNPSEHEELEGDLEHAKKMFKKH
jgi:hypothetical protein